MPAQYLRQIADRVRGGGGDARAWLERAGLREPLGASEEVSFQAFRDSIVSAMTITQEPALGLLVGERLLASTHGILGYAAMNSGSLRQAIDLFQRYIALRLSLVAITTSEDRPAGVLRVSFVTTRPLGDAERPVLEAVMLATKNVFDVITMGSSAIREVVFPFPKPTYVELARELFRVDVRYGQRRAGFSLSLEVLDEPLKMSDPTAFEEAARICQRDLDKLTGREALSSKVRSILLEKQGGFSSLKVTAQLLHMTERTLHRRLVDEGTSFKAILEDVRHALALEHLRSGRLTIQEISFALGYSDVANFRRAFKRWESVPPSAYENISSAKSSREGSRRRKAR